MEKIRKFLEEAKANNLQDISPQEYGDLSGVYNELCKGGKAYTMSQKTNDICKAAGLCTEQLKRGWVIKTTEH